MIKEIISTTKISDNKISINLFRIFTSYNLIVNEIF